MNEYFKNNYEQINRYFAATYYNLVWDILDDENKTKEDLEEMKHLSHASFQHWIEVEDCPDETISLGYWQLSRVYSMAKEGENANYYADRCLEITKDSDLDPFFFAYAYEAKARALKTLKKIEEAEIFIKKAKKYLPLIKDEDSKKIVTDDLKSI